MLGGSILRRIHTAKRIFYLKRIFIFHSPIEFFYQIVFCIAFLGVTIVIDNKALMALVGTEMDWVEDDLKAEFVFNNPNSKVHR